MSPHVSAFGLRFVVRALARTAQIRPKGRTTNRLAFGIRHSAFGIPRPAPRGAVLLLLLFLMAVSVPLVCVLLEAQTTQVRVTHNVVGDVTALYVAEAGVHDAISQLLLSGTWRTGFTNKEFPTGLGHTYTVTLVDDPPGKITIASTSKTADGYSKTVTAVLGGF